MHIMCMYLYAYMCICVYVYMCICNAGILCMYIYVYIYTYMSAHTEPTALQRSYIAKISCTLLLRLLQYITSFCENDNK